MTKKIILAIFILICSTVLGCGVKDKIDDALDVVNVDRKPINRSKTGVNAFVNDSRFGSIGAQFGEVQKTLGIGFVRVLMNWDDGVQPTPGSTPNFSFYDSIVGNIPAGLDVLLVLTDLPSWMSNSANWIDGDPRKTFVELWVKRVAKRYAGNRNISAIQVWNEPNMTSNPDNQTLNVATNPENYAAMLSMAFTGIRSVAPGKRVVNAATTSINQNYPDTIDYNERMVAAGVDDSIDIFAAHYYGNQFEKVVVNGGVADFLNGLSKPIWITESGAQGVNNQLAYVETAWPFLADKIPGIQRFYYYQFTEATPSDVTYGLRNLTPGGFGFGSVRLFAGQLISKRSRRLSS